MKTKTTTQIKLPDYAVEIALNFQKRRRKYLFPKVHLAVFNERLKKIGELAGWTETVEKVRKVKGEYKTILSKVKQHFRFCDLMSSHIMRRSVITNMLILGTDETTVRKISGHAAGSKEFYRYIAYAQQFIDKQTDQYFNLLKE